MYRCPICGECFEDSDSLRAHDAEKHNGVIYDDKFVDDFNFVMTINCLQQVINYNFN